MSLVSVLGYAEVYVFGVEGQLLSQCLGTRSGRSKSESISLLSISSVCALAMLCDRNRTSQTVVNV